MSIKVREKDDIDQKITKVFRTARKYLGYNQSQMANLIGVTQGSISKIESGVLVPTAKMMMMLAAKADLRLRDFELGIIDFNQDIELENISKVGSFKQLPRKYGNNSSIGGREISSLNEYFKEELGDHAFHNFLASEKIDVDYFNVYDNQINLNYFVRLIDTLKVKRGFSQQDLPRALNYLRYPTFHGEKISSQYQNANNSVDVLKIFVQNSSKYSCSYDYSIEEAGNDSIQIKIEPRKHYRASMKKYSKTVDLLSFFDSYHAAYLQNIAQFSGRSGVNIKHLAHLGTDKKCVLSAQCIQ